LLAHIVRQTAVNESDLDALQMLIDQKKRSLKKTKRSSAKSKRKG